MTLCGLPNVGVALCCARLCLPAAPCADLYVLLLPLCTSKRDTRLRISSVSSLTGVRIATQDDTKLISQSRRP